MTDYMLSVPEDVYQRAQKLAQEISQSVDSVLLKYLPLLADSVPILSPDEESELQALHALSDDALWTIAREQMASNTQARMQILMDKNSLGTIDTTEYQELEQLVERGQRLMLRKSEAMAILTERGHRVSASDLKNSE